jgi:uncharacterized cofD-like protein
MYKKIKVVCFGGGTGLPALLTNLKDNPWLEITAIVNVTDTGGSSGELKDRFGILPPGDVLKCLLALSRQEGARELLLKRIRNSEYNGHTGGNILLLGLEKVYGNFTGAIEALSQLLSVQGKVIPVTLESSTLCAEYADGSVYRGETSVDMGIHEGKKLSRLFLDRVVSVSIQAEKAIQEADMFCVGPGSFYTSILPNFLPLGVSDVMRRAKGKIIYIANLLTEGKGMQGIRLDDIVATAEKYIGRPVDHVVANHHLPSDRELLDRYAEENKYPLIPRNAEIDSRFVLADLWLDKTIARHDSARLAHVIFDLINASRF